MARRATKEEHINFRPAAKALSLELTGFMHRWRESTPVGIWEFRYESGVLEARVRYDLSGQLVGVTFWNESGRIVRQTVDRDQHTVVATTPTGASRPILATLR